jgi:hypothetical protein
VYEKRKILFFMFLHFNELSITEYRGGAGGVWVKIKQRKRMSENKKKMLNKKVKARMWRDERRQQWEGNSEEVEKFSSFPVFIC